MIAERKTSWRIFSIIVAFMLVFTSLMISTVTVDAAKAKPKSITLESTAKKVDIKGKVEVSVKSVKPAKASKNVTWKSSDKKIATVSKKGVVTGKKPGKVTITATSKANKKVKETIKITVKDLKPTKVALDQKTVKLLEGGDTLKLNATLKPVGVYNKGVTWKSSDPSVATVSKKGVVTPLKAGTAEITVTTKEKKKTAKCTVTVVAPVDPVIPIAPGLTEFTLNMGTFAQLPASEGAAYKSGDEVIAVVNKDGVVTPKAAGTTEITSGSNSWKVTVSDKTLMNNWVMTGYYQDALINNTAIGIDATAYVWNNDAGKFEAAERKAETVLGSYVQLTDQDGDTEADVILAVKYKDGANFWVNETTWIDGAGADRAPNALSDEEFAAMYAEEYRVPMGERLLANWGLGDWSGTTDFANLDTNGNNPYWINTDADWYNLNSTDTLTMLTGFRTQLQETGSTCVMNSAITVLDWYGVRGDLNSRDLSSLRDEDRAGGVGGTSLDELENVFEKLGELGLTYKWEMEGYNQLGGGGYFTSEWLQGELKKGHPVIVIWDSWGAHGQVIIGYDNMGTKAVQDDVLIMMDPYDSTDHNNDGYIIQSYQRLQYGLLTWKNKKTEEYETTNTKYLSVWPADEKDGEYAPKNVPAEKAAKLAVNEFTANDEGKKIPYGNTANDIKAYYPETEIYNVETGLSGPAGVERQFDVPKTAYYDVLEAYGTEEDVRASIGSDTLKILDNFETLQQSTEYLCGVTSALMTINHFEKNGVRTDAPLTFDEETGAVLTKGEALETDVSLATHRQIDPATGIGPNAATMRAGMLEIFDYMSKTYDQKWKTFTDLDMVYDADWEVNYVGEKGLETDLMPYLIDNNIPMMIGWDEWGGHWQVVIGFDDMGTEATQDDVLILADPYDTTDHNQNGYVLESWERLVYAWTSVFEEENNGYDFVVAIPDTEEYADVIKTLGLN